MMLHLYSSETITTHASDSSGTVSDVRLTLGRQEDVNILSISFFYELGKNWKPVDFLLRPLPTIPALHLQTLLCKKVAEKKFTVIDLYPLNGTVKGRKFKITDFVRPIHRKEIEQHIEILDEIDCEKGGIRCLVIDFKDKTKRYDCLEDISSAENDFAAFFRGDGSDKTSIQADIYNLFNRCKVNFFINEGSLKANLLKKAFSPEQSNFFQDSEKGSQLLCQLCEVIMNGFKQGCEVVVNGCQFNPNDYISFINNVVEKKEDKSCEGEKLPAIGLITLYPNCYKETYSIKSAYYQLITNISRTIHEDKNGTTIIAIE